MELKIFFKTKILWWVLSVLLMMSNTGFSQDPPLDSCEALLLAVSRASSSGGTAVSLFHNPDPTGEPSSLGRPTQGMSLDEVMSLFEAQRAEIIRRGDVSPNGPNRGTVFVRLVHEMDRFLATAIEPRLEANRTDLGSSASEMFRGFNRNFQWGLNPRRNGGYGFISTGGPEERTTDQARSVDLFWTAHATHRYLSSGYHPIVLDFDEFYNFASNRVGFIEKVDLFSSMGSLDEEGKPYVFIIHRGRIGDLTPSEDIFSDSVLRSIPFGRNINRDTTNLVLSRQSRARESFSSGSVELAFDKWGSVSEILRQMKMSGLFHNPGAVLVYMLLDKNFIWQRFWRESVPQGKAPIQFFFVAPLALMNAIAGMELFVSGYGQFDYSYRAKYTVEPPGAPNLSPPFVMDFGSDQDLFRFHRFDLLEVPEAVKEKNIQEFFRDLDQFQVFLNEL